MSDEARPIASPSQTVGPFFHFGLATDARLGCVSASHEAGERIRLRVRVVDGDGVPVPDALVELYQADAGGTYPPSSDPNPAAFTGFGRQATDADGSCAFETIHPGAVDSGQLGRQASHITVCLLARGLLRQLYTRIYFAGDAGHDRDPVLALVPVDRRETLIATRAPDSSDVWDFVIRLQGERETVFFDF
jgi:protocatechuate 3,4-dioxygenase, alpha subunit